MEIDCFYLFTASGKLVDECLQIAPVSTVYCEKNRVDVYLNDVCRLHSIPLRIIEGYGDIAALESCSTQKALGLSYGFGLIFRESDIAKYYYGIWNIHTGRLPENRGRHPISWSLLKNSVCTWLSLHAIDAKIDRGLLLAEKPIQIYAHDDTVTISEKMTAGIDAAFLLQAMRAYDHDTGVPIDSGTYNPSLTGMFDGTDLSELDGVYAFNAFRSQRPYGGILFNGRKYSQCHFYDESVASLLEDFIIVTCRDGIRLAIN